MWCLWVIGSLLLLIAGDIAAPSAQAQNPTLDAWRQGWFDYERELQGWCTQHYPTKKETCLKEEMAKQSVSPTFFDTLRRQPPRPASALPAPKASPPSATPSCCRYCSKGKPCGNSCIAVNRTCHQPPGCAC